MVPVIQVNAKKTDDRWVMELESPQGGGDAQLHRLARWHAGCTGTRSGPCQAKEANGAHDRLQLMILGKPKSNPDRGIVADNQQHCI